MPKAPSADTVFRSAWIPAPPEESEPAMISTRGTIFRLPLSASHRPGPLFPGHLPEEPFVAAAGDERLLQPLQLALRQAIGQPVQQPPAPAGQFGELRRSVHVDPLRVP